MSTHCVILVRRLTIPVLMDGVHYLQSLHFPLPSPPPAVEAALADHCWIPFGVQSHYVGPEGKRLYLQTSVNAMEMKEEEGIFLEVPPGAISPSKSVEIHSAIIPNGSFTLPEGYQLGSMVVYINYDNKRVTQLLRLHLPHWYGGEDHVRDGLSFAMAPHVLKEGELEYHFELLEGGTFTEQQQCGVLQISGHCTLFAAVFKVKVSSFYYASLWTHQKSDLNFWIRVVVTYADPVWIEVGVLHTIQYSRVSFNIWHVKHLAVYNCLF